MFTVEKLTENKFLLIGDNDRLRDLFHYKMPVRTYNYRTKKFDWKEQDRYLYATALKGSVVFKSGFASFIYYHLNSELDDNSKDILMGMIKSDIQFYFSDLRGTQQEDINRLLKFKRGVFSVYTGYGKTQVISKLIDYIVNVRKEHVLVITPGSKALDEVVLRVKEIAGLSHSYFDYDSLYNAININGFLRSSSYKKDDPYWKKVKWIIADECEYCLTESSHGLFDLCSNAEYCYGFSGTADKSCAEVINMRDGLTEQIKRNKGLISQFGFTVVYRKPEGFDIEVVDIKTSIFNDLADVRMTDDVTYSEVVKEIFVNPRFCAGLKKIVYKERGGIYIPMGRLEVIYHWLKNVFTWEGGTIVNICGAGIQVWSEGELRRSITLQELKMMVSNNEVDLIVGTQSSYRAIDLPNLSKILPLTSQIASNVLQQIGRVARKRKFQIFNLIPMIYVSCYTNDLKRRISLIDNYYEECNVRRFKRLETEYEIF